MILLYDFLFKFFEEVMVEIIGGYGVSYGGGYVEGYGGVVLVLM